MHTPKLVLPSHSSGLLPLLQFLSTAFTAFTLTLGASSPAHAISTHVLAAGGQYAEGELLVKFTNGGNSARALEINRYVGTKAVQTFNHTGWQRLKMPSGLTTAQALKRFSGLSGVSSVQLNYRRHFVKTPNDPSYSSQWFHEKIGTPTAWNTTVGSSSVVVAIIDSGLRLTHQDIAANLWTNSGEIPDNGIDDDGDGYVDDVHGWNAADDNGDPSDADSDGHGTHVAGLIGAVGNNGIGVSGVNWNVSLMPLRFIGADGSGYDSDAIECFDYMIAQKNRGVNVRIANCSWGGSDPGAALEDAIQQAGNAGILTLAAAGNGDSRGIGQNDDINPNYPAAYDLDSIVSVAASDENDNRTSWSNYGPSSVDLAAPGADILSTIASSDSAYASYSGTSMATPVVSGAAALILSQSPGLSVSALKAKLLSSVTKLPQWSGLTVTGGRLDLSSLFGNTTYSLSGLIYALDDNNNQVPLSGAKVTLSSGASATSGSAGTYSFAGLAAGSYTLTVSLDGYNSSSANVTIGDSNVTQNFKLTTKVVAPTTYTISGQVLSKSGGAISGAQIFVNGSSTAAATTDSKGAYSLTDEAAGTYTLIAKKSGYTVSANSSTPATVELPTSGDDASPNATINFVAVANSTAPSISINDVSLIEGNAGTRTATFTVTLSPAQTKVVTVNYTTADANKTSATAALDYAAKQGTLTFAAGQTTKSIAVTVYCDRIDEVDENFRIKLSAPVNATVADNEGIATIIDDDPTPVISLSATKVTEGNAGDRTPATLNFTVSLSAPSSRTVTMQMRTVPGVLLPASGLDYVALKTQTLSFAPGETSKIVPVEVKGDSLNEDNERGGLELSKPLNANLSTKAVDGKLVAEGTIVDDDPKPSISINDVSVTEGNKGTKLANFSLTLSAVSGREVSVDFTTAKVTAAPGMDFVGQSGSLTFAPGKTRLTLSIQINGDTTVESNEQFKVLLSRNVNASLTKSIGVGTIINDDSSSAIAVYQSAPST